MAQEEWDFPESSMGGCPEQTATVEVEFYGAAPRLGEHLLSASSETDSHGFT
jgi:hypothetical protein